VYRDYGPKGVKFFFVYKALAHPERSGILQPITQEERLLQAREATKRLGNTIPAARHRYSEYVRWRRLHRFD